MVYALAAGSFYRLHDHDRYQGRFLAGGVSAALLISSSYPMVSLPHLMALKSWLPVMITCALMISAAFHHGNPKWRTQPAEASEDIDEKHADLEI